MSLSRRGMPSLYPNIKLADYPNQTEKKLWGGWLNNYYISTPIVKNKSKASPTLPLVESILPQFPLTPKLLDGFLILHTCHTDEPEDVCLCRLPSHNLNILNAEDFSLFINLVHLDLSDNHIPFAPLGEFRRLKILELACNNLTHLQVPVNYFSELSVLDLSCNTLSDLSILALGYIPRLRSLDLSSNQLTMLPKALTGQHMDEGGYTNFNALENLILDNNQLESPSIFQSLAGLQRLQYLNLDRNKILFIPRLVPEEIEGKVPSILAFTHLQFLSLVGNQITYPADVMPIADWPRLHQVNLWDNPIITHHKCMPTPLVEILVKGKGINILGKYPKLKRLDI